MCQNVSDFIISSSLSQVVCVMLFVCRCFGDTVARPGADEKPFLKKSLPAEKDGETWIYVEFIEMKTDQFSA